EFDDAEIEESEVLEHVTRLCKVQPSQFEAWEDRQKREKITYYGEAAVYRTLYGHKGRQREKRFAGFKDLAFLSSGFIRYFQEVVAVSYYLTFDDAAPGPSELLLPADKQSRAVHFVSTHNVTTLSRNVEALGEA